MAEPQPEPEPADGLPKTKPRFSSAEAVRLAKAHFGIDAREAADLPSYDDQNFRITDAAGTNYCLKFAAENAECRGFCNAAATKAMCDMENEAMDVIRAAG
eukprot:SAG22_NODE_23_length_31399_cov_35.631313_12_plen_101_part_00